MLEPSMFPQARQQARTLAEAGDSGRARAVLEQAVEQGRAGLVHGDPEVLATMRELARLQAEADDPAAARRVLEEALAAGQQRGPADPLMLMLAFDLALVAEQLGNRHVARTQFARVAEFGPAALGEDDQAVLTARAHLADETASPPASAPPVIFAPETPPKRSRMPWVLAALGVILIVVVVTVVAVVARPEKKTTASGQSHPAVAEVRLTDEGTSIVVQWDDPAAGGASIFTVSGGPQGQAPAAMGQAGPAITSVQIDGLDTGVNYCFAVITTYGTTASATSPQTCTNRTVTTVPPAAAASATTTNRPTAGPTTETPTPPAVTRITSPADGGKAPWSFPARFALSPADASAAGSVLALSICVSGRCYLDGEVQISGGRAAPYAIRLGSTQPEGANLKWTVRIDRLSDSAYAKVVAERDAEIADSSWGDKGTSMSLLNATPVSSVTVTKS